MHMVFIGNIAFMGCVAADKLKVINLHTPSGLRAIAYNVKEQYAFIGDGVDTYAVCNADGFADIRNFEGYAQYRLLHVQFGSEFLGPHQDSIFVYARQGTTNDVVTLKFSIPRKKEHNLTPFDVKKFKEFVKDINGNEENTAEYHKYLTERRNSKPAGPPKKENPAVLERRRAAYAKDRLEREAARAEWEIEENNRIRLVREIKSQITIRLDKLLDMILEANKYYKMKCQKLKLNDKERYPKTYIETDKKGNPSSSANGMRKLLLKIFEVLEEKDSRIFRPNRIWSKKVDYSLFREIKKNMGNAFIFRKHKEDVVDHICREALNAGALHETVEKLNVKLRKTSAEEKLEEGLTKENKLDIIRKAIDDIKNKASLPEINDAFERAIDLGDLTKNDAKFIVNRTTEYNGNTIVTDEVWAELQKELPNICRKDYGNDI